MRLLGKREPEIYGRISFDDLMGRLKDTASSLDIETCFFQSNHEGDIVDKINSACDEHVDGIIINPAAYTHTSIAIHDALKAVALPAIEVHISNIHSRDSFRNVSMTAPACLGLIAGLGVDGYEWALKALAGYLKKNTKSDK